jgi:hypothetical protein
MNINDLTEDQAIELLNTDFGPELEKQASAIVEAEEYVEYGQQLALEKIAAMEEAYSADNIKDADYDQEKIASADIISECIQQGFVETMMKMGSANYDDELIYLEEMAKEAGIYDDALKAIKKLPKMTKGYYDDTLKAVKKLPERTKGYFTAEGIKGSKAVQNRAKNKLIANMKAKGNQKDIQRVLNTKKARNQDFLSLERAERIAKKRRMGAYGAGAAAGTAGLLGAGYKLNSRR